LAGWRKVEVNFGDPIAPTEWLALSKEELPEFVRQRITALRPK
jgi:hypothetical protein